MKQDRPMKHLNPVEYSQGGDISAQNAKEALPIAERLSGNKMLTNDERKSIENDINNTPVCECRAKAQKLVHDYGSLAPHQRHYANSLKSELYLKAEM